MCLNRYQLINTKVLIFCEMGLKRNSRINVRILEKLYLKEKKRTFLHWANKLNLGCFYKWLKIVGELGKWRGGGEETAKFSVQSKIKNHNKKIKFAAWVRSDLTLFILNNICRPLRTKDFSSHRAKHTNKKFSFY